jgi:hypothetical protein
MNKHLRLALVILLCCACSFGALNHASESGSKAPLANEGRAEAGSGKPSSIEDLVPEGWTIEQTVTGDLNGDGRPDAAVVLLQRPAQGTGEDNVERARALLLLFADSSGGYRREALAERVLPCTTCLGMLGAYLGEASPVDVSIADGRLGIGWLRGSRESVEVSLEFGYDAAGGGFRLRRDDVIRVDRVLGRETHTVRDFVTGEVQVDGKKHKIEPKVIPIADVDFKDY